MDNMSTKTSVLVSTKLDPSNFYNPALAFGQHYKNMLIPLVKARETLSNFAGVSFLKKPARLKEIQETIGINEWYKQRQVLKDDENKAYSQCVRYIDSVNSKYYRNLTGLYHSIGKKSFYGFVDCYQNICELFDQYDLKKTYPNIVSDFLCSKGAFQNFLLWNWPGGKPICLNDRVTTQVLFVPYMSPFISPYELFSTNLKSLSPSDVYNKDKLLHRNWKRVDRQVDTPLIEYIKLFFNEVPNDDEFNKRINRLEKGVLNGLEKLLTKDNQKKVVKSDTSNLNDMPIGYMVGKFNPYDTVFIHKKITTAQNLKRLFEVPSGPKPLGTPKLNRGSKSKPISFTPGQQPVYYIQRHNWIPKKYEEKGYTIRRVLNLNVENAINYLNNLP